MSPVDRFNTEISEAVDALIGAGHLMEAVFTYPMPKIQNLLILAHRRSVKNLLDLAFIMRSVYHADGKDFKNHMESLE